MKAAVSPVLLDVTEESPACLEALDTDELEERLRDNDRKIQVLKEENVRIHDLLAAKSDGMQVAELEAKLAQIEEARTMITKSLSRQTKRARTDVAGDEKEKEKEKEDEESMEEEEGVAREAMDYLSERFDDPAPAEVLTSLARAFNELPNQHSNPASHSFDC